jgi:hypothetical protein
VFASGVGLLLNPQLRRIAAEMRAELTSAEIALSGSYFDDVLRDPRRYAIENTTDKVRPPGAVRRRRDTACTERRHLVEVPLGPGHAPLGNRRFRLDRPDIPLRRRRPTRSQKRISGGNSLSTNDREAALLSERRRGIRFLKG